MRNSSVVVTRAGGWQRWLPFAAAFPLLAAAWGAYVWVVQRVEVGQNQVLVLTRKIGAELPSSGEAADAPVVLPPGDTKHKGIRYEVFGEGRYFFDPFIWRREIHPAEFVEQGDTGIKVRKFGKRLPQGQIVAQRPEERGPLADVLQPGRYNVNPYAYSVQRVGPIVIPAGYVGVQTLISGAEPTSPNEYLVKSGERGVQPDVLPPGFYRLNPYVVRVDLIETRSHTIELGGDDTIRFPSNDSFDIVLDASVEYAVRQESAPYVMVAVGDHDDVRDKLILPFVRSLCRIEGSKLDARDFIAGDKRAQFQQRVFEGLRAQCFSQGVEIRATLIRRIVPPQEIAAPISDRQLAGQHIKQYENEIKLAEAETKLVEQQEMQKRNQELGKANREVVSLTTDAEQRRAVAVTQAQQRLEVARLALQSAIETAAATVSRGEADAQVVQMQFESRAKPLADAVSAFGDGEVYAQFFYLQKLAPALKNVLATTDGPFGEVFRALRPREGAPRILPKSAPAPAARLPDSGAVRGTGEEASGAGGSN